MHDSRWRSLLYCLARATWSIGRSQTPVCTFWWMTRIIDYTHISMALFSANGRSKAAQRIISLNIVNPLFLRIEMKTNHDVHYQSQLGAMWICWPPHLSCSIHYERCLICQLLKMRIRRPCTFRKTNVSTDGTPVFACPLPFQTNLIKTVTSRFVCHALFERLTCQGAKCQGSFTFCFFDPNLIRIKPSRFGGRAVSEKNNLSTVEMSIFVYSLLIRNNSDKNENAQKCLPRTFLQKILCQRVKCPDLFTLCFVKTNLLMFFLINCWNRYCLSGLQFWALPRSAHLLTAYMAFRRKQVRVIWYILFDLYFDSVSKVHDEPKPLLAAAKSLPDASICF